MSAINIKTKFEVLINDMINDYETGKIRITVANQHAVYILEDALEVLQNSGVELVQEVMDRFPGADWSSTDVMTFAHLFAKLEIEPLDSAWID